MTLMPPCLKLTHNEASQLIFMVPIVGFTHLPPNGELLSSDAIRVPLLFVCSPYVDWMFLPVTSTLGDLFSKTSLHLTFHINQQVSMHNSQFFSRSFPVKPLTFLLSSSHVFHLSPLTSSHIRCTQGIPLWDDVSSRPPHTLDTSRLWICLVKLGFPESQGHSL